MPDAETTMQSYYAARAAEYDQIYQKPERQADLQRLRLWLPTLFTDSRLFEVACGTGYWTQVIEPLVSEIVALDSSPETIAIAQSRAPRDKVKFLIGDAYDLPRNQGEFTSAFAGFWFSHVPKHRQREFLLGLGKILAPRATVILLDNRYVEGSSHPITETDSEGNRYQTRKLKDGTTHRVLKNFPPETELRSLVDGLGEAAIYTEFEYYWVFKYEAVPR